MTGCTIHAPLIKLTCPGCRASSRHELWSNLQTPWREGPGCGVGVRAQDELREAGECLVSAAEALVAGCDFELAGLVMELRDALAVVEEKASGRGS